MTYEIFLFSQLFMKHVENNDTQYQDLAYDLIYDEVLKHRELFLKSNYNVDVRSEYDCIEDYLSNEIKHTYRSVGDAITGEGELSHYVEYENNQI